MSLCERPNSQFFCNIFANNGLWSSDYRRNAEVLLGNLGAIKLQGGVRMHLFVEFNRADRQIVSRTRVGIKEAPTKLRWGLIQHIGTLFLGSMVLSISKQRTNERRVETLSP